jgi:outer membrane autotransporter protein
MSNDQAAIMRSLRPAHGYRRVQTATLWKLSALAAALASAVLIPGAAHAQAVIDGGATETVPGTQASPWNVGGDLTVGDTTSGTLNILTTGTVINDNGYVGNGVGSIGTVTLTGPSATWTNNLDLTVGVSGTGTVTATDATISSDGGLIGSNAGSNGSVTLTNSQWSLTTVFVGVSGTGNLQVLGGSTLNTNDGAVGANAGSVGTVTIDGAGSAWHANNITVGAAGQGSLTISGGANVDNQYTAIGDASGAVGEVTVTGAGSSWTHVALPAGFTYVGKTGSGTLTVSDGGLFDAGTYLNLGYFAGSSATVTVTGANSEVTTSGGVSTNSGDSANVTISDGGILNVSGNFNLNSPSTTLLIESGATVTTGEADIGNFSGLGTTTVTLTGSGTTWTNASFGLEMGTMTISAGATMTSAGYSFLGDSGTGPAADVIITGAGSSWTVNDELDIGYFGGATVDVLAGGTLNTVTALVGAYSGGPTSGEVNVDGAGSTWTNSGDLTVGYGDVVGSDPVIGTLNITNGGVVSTDNAFIGSQPSGIGTINVGGAGTSSQFNVTTDLIVGDQGQGTLNVLEGGTVTAPTMTIANQVGSAGTVNLGAEAGQTPVAHGTLNVPLITFGSGIGTLVFNNTDPAFTFTPEMSGSGNIEVQSLGETIFTANSSGFTGTTTITNGKLAVNGMLGGQVDVDAGGTLQGIGTVGNFMALSGGTVAPGNSIGTLTVSGNVTFQPGSTYAVQITAAGQSDLINATGTATLNGGTVQVTSAPGNYVPTTYTILTAAGGVTGTFAALTTDLALLQARLTYDPTDVFLELYVNPNFCAVAKTQNECAVAQALQQFPADNPLYTAIVGLTAEGAREAFNALSGELHATVSGTLANDSRYVREAIDGRLLQAFYSGGGKQGIALASSSAPTAVASVDSSQRMSLGALRGTVADDEGIPASAHGVTYWSRAFGSWGQFDGNGNAATANRNLGGFITGADAGLGSGWRAGLATGYMNSTINVGARVSSADVNSYVLAGYAGGSYGDLALRTGAAWTWNGIDTTRNVVFPGFYELEKASYNAGAGQLFGEVAYPMLSDAVAWEPFVGLAYVHVGTDSFTESGPIAGLVSDGQSQNVGYSTIGTRIATFTPIAGIMTTPHASVAWQYAFGSTTPEQAFAFASTGIGFGIAGVPLARNSALIEAGLDFTIAPEATLGFSYAGQLAPSLQDNGIRGRLNWRY